MSKFTSPHIGYHCGLTNVAVSADILADPGTLASGNGSDNTDSQVVLGVANVNEDAVLL